MRHLILCLARTVQSLIRHMVQTIFEKPDKYICHLEIKLNFKICYTYGVWHFYTVCLMSRNLVNKCTRNCVRTDKRSTVPYGRVKTETSLKLRIYPRQPVTVATAGGARACVVINIGHDLSIASLSRANVLLKCQSVLSPPCPPPPPPTSTVAHSAFSIRDL